RLLRPSLRPVRLEGSFTHKDGGTTHVISPHSVVGRSRVYAPVVTVDGQPSVPPKPPGPEYAALAHGDRDVADALRLLGADDDPDWVALWKVFEIVQHAAGGRDAVADNGWADSGD